MVETTISIEREVLGEYKEYEIIIRGEVEPDEPAITGGHIDNWEPASGGYSSIEEVLIDVKGVEKRWTGKLTDKEEDEAREALFDQFKADCEDDCDPPDSGYDDYCDDYGDYGPDIYDF